jgi:putative colanic acid biosynthesis acetyltransferase WcaF
LKKVQLDAYQNDHYHPGHVFKRALWYVVGSLVFESAIFPVSGPKAFLLRLFGARVGKGLIIKPRVQIKYPWLLVIGDHVWIGERVWIDNLAPVIVGSHVCISQQAMLLTGNHDYNSVQFNLRVEPITLDDGVWVAARSLVLPGTKAGAHTVIGAGAVVRGTLEPFTVYFGNPARAVSKRSLS